MSTHTQRCALRRAQARVEADITHHVKVTREQVKPSSNAIMLRPPLRTPPPASSWMDWDYG